MKEGFYNSFQEVLDILHKNNVKYLILRNYDNLLEPELYQDGHGDVDLLCENSQEIVELLRAKCYEDLNADLYDDGTHYFIYIKEKRLKLDLRHIGDGYYCDAWESDMLYNRELCNKGFYVLDSYNMLYSLIYHALIQKDVLSNEYKTIIASLIKQNNIKLFDYKDFCLEKQYITLLENFMKKNSYEYTYPIDKYVPLNKKYIDKSLIRKDFKLYIKHLLFDSNAKIRNYLVTFKHILKKCFH